MKPFCPSVFYGAILRQDPDGGMVGEIRDSSKRRKLACQASITGHLVMSTLGATPILPQAAITATRKTWA